MKRMTVTTTFLAAVLTFLSFAGSVQADVSTATDENDVILAGHDVVAYFTQSKAVQGRADLTAQYDGAVYRFSSTANRDAFQIDPAKYAPAYGGYCAFGASFGKKFEVDGKAFEVVQGRLYVNKNLNVYETWKKDIPTNIVKAEGQWPTIQNKAASEL